MPDASAQPARAMTIVEVSAMTIVVIVRATALARALGVCLQRLIAAPWPRSPRH